MGSLPTNRLHNEGEISTQDALRILGVPMDTSSLPPSPAAWNFQKAKALKAFSMADLPARATRKTGKPGERIQRNRGLASAVAGGTGIGDAIAETGSGSIGCATAISEGTGESQAITAPNSYGSTTAWSGSDGNAVARVEPGATGSASATSQLKGCAYATVARDAAGNASARTRGAGEARAYACNHGDIAVENLGKANIEVHHHSSGDLKVISNAMAPLLIRNHYLNEAVIRITREGELVLHERSTSNGVSIPPGVDSVEVLASGELLLLMNPPEYIGGNQNS